MANSKHPHCEVIKAWAEGAEIQVKAPGGDWKDCSSRPSWYEAYEYRVKPEPKPDVVAYTRVICPDKRMSPEEAYERGFTSWASLVQTFQDNVKCTFDGETGALKSVEIINGKQ